MTSMIRKAMQRCDDYVLELEYVDSKGERSRRVVSPIRFLGPRRFLALCLCREQPRQFYLDRCSSVKLLPAAEVMMPMPMG